MLADDILIDESEVDEELLNDVPYMEQIGMYLFMIEGFEDTIITVESSHKKFFSPLNNISVAVH